MLLKAVVGLTDADLLKLGKDLANFLSLYIQQVGAKDANLMAVLRRVGC